MAVIGCVKKLWVLCAITNCQHVFSFGGNKFFIFAILLQIKIFVNQNVMKYVLFYKGI